MGNTRKFTLVEVMTALAVFSLFVVLLLQFFIVASNLWHRSEKEVQLAGKANLILSTIENHLKAAKTGKRGSPFFISDARTPNNNTTHLTNSKPVSPFDIMKNNFKDNTRWENDKDAFKNAGSSGSANYSTQLIFAAPSDAKLCSGNKGDFYILCFAQAQDKLVLRVISDGVGSSNFLNYLENYNRNQMLGLFDGDQKDFLGAGNDELGSGEVQNGKVTHLIADHVTRFQLYPYYLNPTASQVSSNGRGLTMETLPADVNSANLPYAMLVEVALLGDEDFLTWKTLCNAADNNSEPEAAADFRTKNEKIFTRLIQIGNPKEIR